MIKPIESLTPLGQALRGFRKKNRYSLDEIAALSGVAKSHLWELESSASANPRLSTLIALAKVMKKPVGWLANRAALSAQRGDK